MLTLGTFSCFFFYKIRVIPEHFWAARRFLPVILPAALLLVGAAAVLPSSPHPLSGLNRRSVRGFLYGFGIVVVIGLGHQYFSATRAILSHVEYAGLIPQLEKLNAHFEDTDLVLVETRQASDMHTLAVPLAYIYSRDVLVLLRRDPDPAVLRDFLSWAWSRYRKVFFVGGNGSWLVSRSITATPVTLERFQVPEYESAVRAYPKEVRLKEFDFGVFELLPRLRPPDSFDLDLGATDDLFVQRFHAKERHGSSGRSFRWTRDVSLVSLLGVSTERRSLTLWLSSGGRPEQALPATARVYVDDVHLGTATPTPNFEPYSFEIPLDLAATLETREEAGRLRIESSTWSPAEILGGPDDRDVGLMLDRITIE